MSLRLEISERAENDLTQQYGWYIKHADADVAERYLGAFHATVLRLATHPGMGRTRKFRSSELSGIRSFPLEASFGVHLIFYRADTLILTIERLVHGARDLPRRLLD